MNEIKFHKITLKRVISFLSLTVLFTSFLNLPSIIFSNVASAATASQYNLVTLTNTEIGVNSKNFKVMEFTIPDSNPTGAQDQLILDGSETTDNGDSLVAFPSNTMFIDQGGGSGFQSGDDIVKDLDNDGKFTSDADFLVDSDGTSSLLAGTTTMTAGATLYDIEEDDYIRADSVDRSSVTQVWHDLDHDGRYTSEADTLVDADGSVTSSTGTASGIGTGSSFALFTNDDHLYYAVTGTQTSVQEISDIKGLWLDNTFDSSGVGVYEVERSASVAGSDIFSDFVITDSNHAIVINVNSSGDEVLNVANGTYSASALALAVDTALEGATGLTGTDDVSVSYDEGTGKFVISNNFTADFDLVWDATSSTIEDQLGFDNNNSDTVIAHKDAIAASGRITVTGGSTGDSYTVSIGSVTGSPVAFDTDYAHTAYALADDINAHINGYTATTNSDVANSSTIDISADSRGTAWNADINVAVVANGASTPSTTDTEMTGGVDAVDAGSITSDNPVNAIILDNSNNTLELTYSFDNGLNGISTTTSGIVMASGVYTDINTLVTAVNNAITANSDFSLTDFTATAVNNHVIFTTQKSGYGVSINVTGGNGKNTLGFSTPIASDGGDSLIYGLGMTAGVTGSILVSQTGKSLVYRDESGSHTGYQDGEYIYIDQGGRNYSSSADELILDKNNNITTTTTGYNVGNTPGWVMQNSSYIDGTDIFIENVAGELTYSASADTLIINGSFAAASGGDTLVAFDVNDKFVDSVSNGQYDASEDIYKETGANSGQVDYESFNAITVSNAETSNPISVDNISSVKLYYEEASTGASFSGGATPTEKHIELNKYSSSYWRSSGNNIQIPDVNGLKIYITIDTNADVVEGQKMQAKVSKLVDSNSNGAYDDNDKGIFVSTTDDGPDDIDLTSTAVTVSAFGALVDDLEDELDDFENEIDDDILYASHSDQSDDEDDISDAIDKLNDLLADPITDTSDVSSIFTELNKIMDAADDLIGLVPTSGDDALTSNKYDDLRNELKDVKKSMNNLVDTVENVIDSTLESKFDDEKDDYKISWSDVFDTLRSKNPDSGTIDGVINFVEDMTDDIKDMINDDIPDVDDKNDLRDIFDDELIYTINAIIDEVNALDNTQEFDNRDLNDLDDAIDDLKDMIDDFISAIESRITAVDTANSDTELQDRYDDKEYDKDVDDDLDDLDDAIAELDGTSVSSSNVQDAIDDLDDNIDDIDDMEKDIADVADDSDVRKFFKDLVNEIEDATDIINDLPCTISDDDIDDLDDSINDTEDKADDMIDALKKSLEDRSLYVDDVKKEFSRGEDDYDDAMNDLEDALKEIDKLQGRCADVDTAGPYGVSLVASKTDLVINETGTDTATITATVVDSASKLLSDTIVNFEITSPTDNKGTLSVTFDRTENGIATCEYTPGASTSGTVIVKAYSATNTDVSDEVTLNIYNGLINGDSGSGSDSGTSATSSSDTGSGDSSDSDDSTGDVSSAATITPVSSTLDNENGGEVVLEVKDENGNPVAGTAVTLSMMDEEGNITSYTGVTGDDGKATIVIPAESIVPGNNYKVLATTGNGSASTGQYAVQSTGSSSTEAKSSSQTTEGGDADTSTGSTTSGSVGDPAVLGDSDTVSGGSSSAASSLPTTGALPLATFVLSSFGSFMLIFKKETE